VHRAPRGRHCAATKMRGSHSPRRNDMRRHTGVLSPTHAAAASLFSTGQDFVIALMTGMLLIAVVPALFGWRTTVVVSGSMTPGIRPGDVVVAGPAARVAPGAVVLVKNPAAPGKLLLHRLVAYQADGSLILKGDANRDRDSTPVPPANLRGVAKVRIPVIGLPVLWLRNHEFAPAAAALALIGILLWWRPRSM
jgi:signal peptidase